MQVVCHRAGPRGCKVVRFFSAISRDPIHFEDESAEGYYSEGDVDDGAAVGSESDGKTVIKKDKVLGKSRRTWIIIMLKTKTNTKTGRPSRSS